MRKSLISCLVLTLAIALVAPTLVQAQDDVVTLTYWDWWNDQTPAMEAIIDAFEAEHPGIRIERVVQAEYTTTLPLAYESGDMPDVFGIHPDIEWGNYLNWLLPVNGMQGFGDWYATVPDAEARFAEGQNVHNGEVVTAPWEVTRPWLYVYVNTALYKEVGIVDENGEALLPETMEQMVENARIIQEETGTAGWVTQVVDDWALNMNFWLCQRSGGYVTADGAPLGWDAREGRFMFSTNPCYRQMIDLFLTMRDEEILERRSLSIGMGEAQDIFGNGEAAHLVNGSWAINYYAENFPDLTDYTIVNVPLIGTDEQLTPFVYGPGGRKWGVSNQTDHPQEAFEFWSFLYSETVGNMWAEYGHGRTIFTTLPSEEFLDTPARIAQDQSTSVTMVGPSMYVRNPNVSQVNLTLTGPNESQIWVDIMIGEIDDIDAALNDLDERYMAALEQGIADAQAAGYEITIEDYIFEDWNPNEPYVTTPR